MKTLLLTPALLLAGCITNVAPPPLSPNHPASPEAAVAPLPAVSQTLQSYEPIAAAEPRPQMDHSAMQGMDQGSMDHGSMKGMDDGSMKGMDHSSMKGMESKDGAMKGMDDGSMKGMDHGAMKEGDSMSKPGKSQDSTKGEPSMQGMDHGSMDHGAMKGMESKEGSMKGMDHGAHWMAPEAAAARKNPVPATKESVKRGQALFQQNCVVCHGAKGRGDGPAGAGLNPKPADLAAMAGEHPDGDFAWKIENGRGVMPPWKGVLTQNQIWDLVNYTKNLGGVKADSEKSGGGRDHSQHKH